MRQNIETDLGDDDDLDMDMDDDGLDEPPRYEQKPKKFKSKRTGIGIIDDIDDAIEDGLGLNEDNDNQNAQNDGLGNVYDDGFGGLGMSPDMMDDGFGGYRSPPMDSKRDLLQHLTNFKDMLAMKRHTWSGDVLDENGKWILGAVPPTMNQQGINQGISFLQRYAHPSNFLTHLDRENFWYIMTDIVENTWDLFGRKKEGFGIKTEEELQYICDDIEHTAMLILIGAAHGEYKKFFGSTASFNYNMNPNNMGQNFNPYNPQQEPQKRGSFFSRVLGMK